MITSEQNPFNLNLGHETLVMGWIDVRQSITNRGGGQMIPIAYRFAKPLP